MSDRLLTTAQLAAKWGWPAGRLYRLVFARAIPHHKIESRLFFAEAEVEQWLASSRVAVQAPAMEERPQPAPAVTRETECQRLGIPVDHAFS